MKRTIGWKRRETSVNLLALIAFLLTALVFIYLLYVGQALPGIH